MDLRVLDNPRLPGRYLTEGPEWALLYSNFYALGLLRQQIHQPPKDMATGHVEPKGVIGGPIMLIKDSDIITHETDSGSGTIWKYARTVDSAKDGAAIHPGHKSEKHVYADL